MKLFSRKPSTAQPAPRPPPPLLPSLPAKVADTKLSESSFSLKLDLPDVFAYEQDETKARANGRKTLEEDAEAVSTRGTVLLVESDVEVGRLIARLFRHEGFTTLSATCLAEARPIVKETKVNFLLARRASVPLNLQTEIALRDLQAQTTVRIVDEFSELMLGQVIDYESMAQCTLGLIDLVVSLLEGANVGARGHAHTVAKYCRLVGQRMGLTRRDLDALTMTAYLHDLGSLETNHNIGAQSPGTGELLPPSLRSTLDLLANIAFPYNISGLLMEAGGARTRNTPAAEASAESSLAPLGARILRVVDAYDTVRRSNHELQNEDALFDWLRHQPEGTLDTDALETLIHVRKNERTISAMNIFWAAVLLVDPHPEELQLLRLRLENDDYHVLTAKSVEEALQHLRQENVTVILSEFQFVVQGDGLQLLEAVKNDPALRQIPLVFHASANTDSIKQALELGAEDWFAKPHNIEITAMKLARIIGRASASPAAADGVHGNLRDLNILDMVQILSASGRSAQILLENSAHTAELFLHHGQIIKATCGELTGEIAVLDILGWQKGQFRLLPLRKAPPTAITATTDTLLLQSCLEQDRRRQLHAPDAPNHGATP